MANTGAEKYTAASGSEVGVLGIRRPLCWFQDDSQHVINVKVLAPLNRALFAVSELVKTCKVVFDSEEYGGSYMEHRKTGQKIKIYLRRGIFVMPIWIKRKPPPKMLAAQWDERAPASTETEVPDPFRGQELLP